MHREMPILKPCAKCNKSFGACYCTGCKTYFCFKDFLDHRNQLKNEIDRVFEECINLQGNIIEAVERNDYQSPVLATIDEWEKATIEKVKKAAEQARRQVVTILNTKRVEIPNEFKKLTEELVQRKESEDFVEHDLTRLKEKLRQLDENVKELAYPPAIVLNTKLSDQISWQRLIYVQEKFTPSAIEQQSLAINEYSFRKPFFTDYIRSKLFILQDENHE